MDNATSHASVDEGDFGMIKDFIEHVRGIIPLLEHVKDSIEDSSSRIPKASMQLSEVTTATESATVEILNVLEAMTARIGQAEHELNLVDKFIGALGEVPGGGEAKQSIAAAGHILTETKDNSMNIAIALQVQDITSQQIAGVSHTIESIRLQLSKALKRFEEPGSLGHHVDELDQNGPEIQVPPDHFDGEARFSKATDRQDLADEIVKQWSQKNGH
jgi:chemotaxis regulatin CheY-phosphate phosphatase CheZ